ncbi:MAG: hypothetical protein AAGH45_09705 [Pseudomonadota bacterium]
MSNGLKKFATAAFAAAALSLSLGGAAQAGKDAGDGESVRLTWQEFVSGVEGFSLGAPTGTGDVDADARSGSTHSLFDRLDERRIYSN